MDFYYQSEIKNDGEVTFIQGRLFLLHLHAHLVFSFEEVQTDSNGKLNLLCFSNFYHVHSF